jgi:hypothetical protein
VVRWGVITYFTDAVNSLYTHSMKKLEEFVGTPVERFNHNAINEGNENLNFMYMILSGMSPINDRAKRITNRIEELKQALAGDDSSKYVLAGDNTYADVLARRQEEKRSSTPPEISTADIFKKFMK